MNLVTGFAVANTKCIANELGSIKNWDYKQNVTNELTKH